MCLKKRIKKVLSSGARPVLLVMFCVVAAVLIVLQGRSFYLRYQQSVISTQQQELLTMAETIGQGLSSYIRQELDSIDLYFSAWGNLSAEEAPAPSEEMISMFLSEKGETYDAMCIYDAKGALLAGSGDMTYSEQTVPAPEEAEICGKNLCSGGWYQLFVSKAFTVGDTAYTALFAINLNEIYELIVHPVKIGEGGYSVVKDSSLAIIMHHAASQIGMDAFYDRQEQYPELDLTSLYNWLEMQRQQSSGVSVIESYKWDDPDLTPQKRIVAFTTIHLPGDSWIVNSTIPYEELEAPLRQMIVQLLFICGVLLALVISFTWLQVRSFLRSESQRKEIHYLRRINEGMNLLRRKDEEIQHYQRVQSLGQMSSHIAHEFNNYLTPVTLYGEMLEGDEGLSQENRELVCGILRSAEQASQLSRRLLDFCRQESDVALEALNLTEEVRLAAETVRQLTPKKIRFQAELMEQPFWIKGPKSVGNHLLLNLCNNAYHAMEGSGGTLTVRYTADPAAMTDLPENGREHFALLSVTDTGCGIPKDIMDKIFEPFFTTKRSGKGTGLGLSAVKNILTTMGGQIFVDSQVGVGTSFRLYFPETAPAAEVQPIQSAKLIALVDDDSALLDSLSRTLKRPGRKLSCYDHPAVVISKLQKHPQCFDLILTDYAMPSINGLEFAELARSLSPGIRIILMSGAWDEKFQWYLSNHIIEAFVLKSDLPHALPALLDGTPEAEAVTP